jgi:nucleoid-associated protein YgaU
MRKDVKFGLTIGGIFVATLVGYVIVVTRGGQGAGSAASKIAVAQPGDADSAQTPDTDSTNRPDVASNNTGEQSDKTGTTDNSNSAAPQSDTSAAPATQPAPTAEPKLDWDSALTRGVPPTLSASSPPERTVTPMIDSPAQTAPRSDMALTRTAATPMIDPLSLPAPTTQPAFAMNFAPQRSFASEPMPVITPPSTATPGTPRTHRVTSGESPYSISEEVYGNGMYYKNILAANPGIDPHRLRIGQVLNIPELSDSQKNPASPTGTGTDASAKVDPSSAYQVASGDTLERISRKLYGTPGMIDKLYEMNKTLIGPDENVLKVGWVLRLPQPPSIANAAR